MISRPSFSGSVGVVHKIAKVKRRRHRIGPSHKPLRALTKGGKLLHQDDINAENRVLRSAQIHLARGSFQSSRVSLPITLLLTFS